MHQVTAMMNRVFLEERSVLYRQEMTLQTEGTCRGEGEMQEDLAELEVEEHEGVENLRASSLKHEPTSIMLFIAA
ncbi:hypothetical protein MLD38_008252 [Melastoma candidum]|uniref:Uncharacterized protein n=1 Tax=Melastoma candidum TaxID=119954 RepID=A0ACB9S294_9MYRT|nr:hypothetical protein MLD38_008252 [Melastoma candidum]